MNDVHVLSLMHIVRIFHWDVVVLKLLDYCRVPTDMCM